jgi:vacuolar-type H+-ATPase subunit H
VSSAGSARIFVSYRRSDAGWPARWLADRLAEQFGAGVVFQDVDSIRPGDDYALAIEAAVGSCSVLLALIGPQWLAVEAGTGRRLDDPQDWVRLEIEVAIRRRIRVIPVLLDGAMMPVAEELPQSLQELARRQAVTLSPASLDLRVLVSTLQAVLSTPVTEYRSSLPARSEAKTVVDAERAGVIARSMEDASLSLWAGATDIPEEGLGATGWSGSRALGYSDKNDVSSRAEREAERMLAKADAYAAKIKSDAQARAEGLERDGMERHRKAMTFLGVYSGTDAAERVLPLAQQIADQVIAYGRREATNIITDAQAWAKHLEQDAQDWQGRAKIPVSAQDDEADTALRVFSLAREVADQAITDARHEATNMVANSQKRMGALDRDVLERHCKALEFARIPSDEKKAAERMLSRSQAAAYQAIADARREAARIVADAEARTLIVATRHAR